MIQTLDCKVVVKLSGGTLRAALVTDLDQSFIRCSMGRAPIVPAAQLAEKRHLLSSSTFSAL